MKHFKLTSETKINALGIKVFRIECIIDSKWAKVGDKGGWIEKENNLSGNAWVGGDAEVSGDAKVSSNAKVSGDAKVSGNAEVNGDAWVSGNACVGGNAWICGNADYCCFQYFGSANRTTTAFKQKDGSVAIKCGCFFGSLDVFVKQVEKTHGDNKYGKQYKAIIEVIKAKFDL